MIALGVDVGGTFTDLVLADVTGQNVHIRKTPSTPENPALAIITGITEICSEAGIDPGAIDAVFHGTTVGTNAMLVNDGAVTGMITNEGFRDILHIGRHQRAQHYSIIQDLPWQSRPLIPRRFRKTVAGRMDAQGEELVTLDEEAVARAARELGEAGVGSVLVAFLFAHINPEHEQRAATIVRSILPEAFVTTSADVSPQFREFERFTTAAMSAFIGPKLRNYIDDLQTRLAAMGVRGELRIMTSNGGLATPEKITMLPAATLLSGLVAGVRGGAWAGETAGVSRLVTLDIGGTSADIGIIQDGRLTEADSRSAEIAGFPVMLPMIDIHTVGAGGGSIAHIDRGRAFRVGPRSAGAEPGPAAYGKGGTDPTATDANVVLGRLVPHAFLGGRMALDTEASRRVIDELARALGKSSEEAAEGAIRVLNSNMANAIRSRTIQKGIDPRDFTLCAFGGAGPLHAAEVATMLGITDVLVPPYPGIASAFGLLNADLEYLAIRTAFSVSDDFDIERMQKLFDEMDAELHELFARDHVPKEDIRLFRQADIRYVGQGYELRIDVPDGPLSWATLDTVIAAFHDRHRMEYGHSFENSVVEIVTLRMRGLGLIEKLDEPPPPPASEAPQILGQGSCIFLMGETLESLPTPYMQRGSLPEGERYPGPVILVQADTTTVVPPGWTCWSDAHGNIRMTHDGQ